MNPLKVISPAAQLRTSGTLLRQWRDEDMVAWFAMNQDEEVRRFMGGPLSEDAAIRQANERRDWIARYGWGKWALEIPGVTPFAGFVGIADASEPHADAIEIGWRLARPYWGKGYATEAALASLAFGFNELGLDEIIAVTATLNANSQAVMKKIGMKHDANDDFIATDLPVNDPLRPTTVMRLSRGQFYRSYFQRGNLKVAAAQ